MNTAPGKLGLRAIVQSITYKQLIDHLGISHNAPYAGCICVKINSVAKKKEKKNPSKWKVTNIDPNQDALWDTQIEIPLDLVPIFHDRTRWFVLCSTGS